ncbi:MAG: TasA family protein [Acidimicrobiales bacterium]
MSNPIDASPMRFSDRPRQVRRLALAGLLVAGGLAAVGAGAFSTFNSTASNTASPQAVNTGTVAISLGASGASTNRLSVAAVNIAPGDTIDRSVDLISTGNLALSTLGLAATASPTTLLTSDTTNGLQLTVTECSVAWTEAGTAPAYTYTCSGTTSTVLAAGSAVRAGANLVGLKVLNGAGTDHLEFHLALPTSADNTFQNLSTSLTYTFTATQRNGQAQ